MSTRLEEVKRQKDAPDGGQPAGVSHALRPLRVSNAFEGRERYETEIDKNPFLAKVRREFLSGLEEALQPHVPKKPSPPQKTKVVAFVATVYPPSPAFQKRILDDKIHSLAFHRELAIAIIHHIICSPIFKEHSSRLQPWDPCKLGKKLATAVYDHISATEFIVVHTVKESVFSHITREEIVEKFFSNNSDLNPSPNPIPNPNPKSVLAIPVSPPHPFHDQRNAAHHLVFSHAASDLTHTPSHSCSHADHRSAHSSFNGTNFTASGSATPSCLSPTVGSTHAVAGFDFKPADFKPPIKPPKRVAAPAPANASAHATSASASAPADDAPKSRWLCC